MKIPTTLDQRTNKMRLFAFALAVWLLIAAMPISAFAELLELETQPMEDQTVYVLAEDASKRSEFEKHYYCSDGTFVAVTYPEAVHYKDESGEWVDVDLRLASDASAASYESQSGDFKTVFRTPAASGDVSVMANGVSAATPAVSMQSGEYTLSWSLTGTKAAASAGTSTYALNPAEDDGETIMSASADTQIQVLGEMKTAEAALSVQKIPVTDPNAFALPAATNQVVYEDVFGTDQNVSVRYSVSLNKIEEDILITAPTEMTSFSMRIECGELSPVKNPDNSIDFLDNYGNMVYHVSTPYLADAAFAVSYDVAVTLTQQDGVCTITYTPDAAWMNAPEREYPIMLDPAVTTNDYTWAIMDTYVVEDEDICYETNQYLVINQSDGKGRAAIVHFTTLPQIDPNMPIISANLKLSTYVGPNGVDLKLESMASGFNLLLDDYPDWKTWSRTEIDRAIYTSGTLVFEFDMTSCITDLYTGNISRDFSISLYDEDATTYVPTIHSANTPFGDSYRPCLTVTYGYNLPEGLSVGDEITIQNAYGGNSGGYLYPNSGLIGNGNSVLHAPSSTSSDTYRLLTLRQNSATGTYRLEYTPSHNSTGAYISADTTTKNVVMHNTTNVPSNIKQDWLIVPDSINTFKIVLASDMRYVMTADTATSGNVLITQCTGNPTARQKWKIYKNGDPIENEIVDSTPLDTDYYYINSPSTGKFLNVSSNTVGTDSGRVNLLGDKIKWKFTQLPDGYYTIQNEAAPGKLLAGVGFSGLAMTLSDGTISENQKWIVSQGTTSYTVTNAGTKFNLIEPGSPNGLWRIVKCSDYVELYSFTIGDISIWLGDTHQVQIDQTTPIQEHFGEEADWVAVTDFHYDSLNTSIATVNASGLIQAVSGGTAEILVTHKTTGITNIFHVTVKKRAVIVIPGCLGSELFIGENNPYFEEGVPIINQEIVDDLMLMMESFSDDMSLSDLPTEEALRILGKYKWELSASNVASSALLGYLKSFVEAFYKSIECNTDGTSKYDVYTKKYIYVPDENENDDIITCPLPDDCDEDQYTSTAGLKHTYYYLMHALHEDTWLSSRYSIEFFSYDWRLSNGYAAERLDDFIEENNYEEVILIAHSMGGLVASGYMGLGQAQSNKVSKVCMIASPLEGAPEAINAWANKDVSALLGDEINGCVDKLNDFLAVVLIETKPIYKLISKYPSVYEMIPTENYISINGSYVGCRIFDNRIGAENSTIRFRCDDYETTMQNMSQFLPFYDQDLMDAAEEFHENCKKGKESNSEPTVWKYFCVTGNDTATSIVCTKTIGVLGVETLEVTKTITQDGDSLVPVCSATVGKNDSSIEEYAGYGHNGIIKSKTDAIIAFLKG